MLRVSYLGLTIEPLMTVLDPPEPMITASNAIPGLTSNEYAAQNRFCCELPCLIAASNLDFRSGPSILIKLWFCAAVSLEAVYGAFGYIQALSSNDSNSRLFIVQSFLPIDSLNGCDSGARSRSDDGPALAHVRGADSAINFS